MGWYNTGYDAAEIEARNPTKKKMYRFWMPVGAEQEITFVDDDSKPLELEFDGKKVKVSLPVLFKEYQLYLNGNWRNWFTQPEDPDDDLLRQNGERASQVAAFTIIDHSEWADRNGVKHKDELKLMVVKTSSSTFKILQKQSAKRKGLRGCRFTVSRLGDKSCNVGDTFEFEEKGDLPKDIQPANYLEEFRPLQRDELAKIIGAVADESEDPIPF